jgi:perosamine synthetase
MDKNLPPLPAYNTIGTKEQLMVQQAMRYPLSGYMGGELKGGYWVERLADMFKETFGTLHAVPCNSATSGLLAACVAAGVGPGDVVWCTAMSMSATAAVALHLGATVKFIDIEAETFCIDLGFEPSLFGEDYHVVPHVFTAEKPKAVIVTNLFGHAAQLAKLRAWSDRAGICLIEDNAQAPFATENGRLTGTVGHMGVFSFNVHKHMQCGEGGIVVTSCHFLANKLRLFVNHAELSGTKRVGLNLRMTEPIAAIACAQLEKGYRLVKSRMELAEAITHAFRDCDLVRPPQTREGCLHSYYVWAGLTLSRDFVTALQRRGIPLLSGYSCLHRLFQTGDYCPVADQVSQSLVLFEVCAYSPKPHHLRLMHDIICEETDRIGGDHDDAGRSSTTADT